ncbi:MAG: hypothetical protein OFPI_21320 [Osedax symbiont Rs2]|nr:MAG: hypothetical protein OFPI_21320 [Osedax symbiont Rs2]
MLDQQIKDNGNADGIKALMADLEAKTALGTLTAIGNFELSITSLTGSIHSDFYTDVTTSATVDAFILANMNLTDQDTGSVHGSDYAGNAAKSALDVISNLPITGTSNDLKLTGLSARIEGGDTTIAFQLGGATENRIVMDRIFVDSEAISGSSIKVTDTEVALANIDDSIQMVSRHQGTLGAYQNRLEHSINNLRVFNQQVSAARSSIVDADMAKEASALSRNQVLKQAAQAMLSQANSSPQQVLNLLQ